MLRRSISCLLAFCLIMSGLCVNFTFNANAEETLGKTRSTFYTAEKVANARENIEKYEWAKEAKDDAVARAAKYLELEDDFFWNIVTPQSVPRSLGVLTRYKAAELGSPGPEGDEINKHGNYPWILDPINHPWKIKSPVTGEMYPTNDFKSYYESGLNEHGEFDPELADEKYLVNESYPERGENWGVEDGYGWTDEDGNNWTFVAYYNHWAIWRGFIPQALNALRDAYLYTGDIRYAHKGLILLDRVADVYPEMDVTAHTWDEGFDNGDPSIHTAQGKVVNDIWETGLVKTFIYAYDAFFPAMEQDPDLVPFLSAKAQKYKLENPKASVDEIRKNIEDGILRQVYPGVKNSQIRGNNGMHQSALALAAIVLDEPGTSQEWLDYVFKTGGLEVVTDSDSPYGRRYIVTGGNMNTLLVDTIDRDGMPNEASPQYNSGWLSQFMQVAQVLKGYERYPEYDLFENVKFKKMLPAFYPMIMLGSYVPTIGDSYKTGNPGLPAAVKSIGNYVTAFEQYGDPLFAQIAYKLNGDTTGGLQGDIFSSDPEKIKRDIEEVISTYGPLKPQSSNLTGYGFTALRNGEPAERDREDNSKDTQRGLWMYYGRNTGHGHKDTLNIGLHAFGLDLSPDLGYPEFTGQYPKRWQWTSNTISHNTVVVDQTKQRDSWVAIPRHYDGDGNVTLIDVEAPKVYPQTERYRRTTAYVKVDDTNSYAVDFFRVKGGNDHHFSFHGAEGTVSIEGLNLVEQPTGTYAGPDVEFGEKEPDEPSGSGYMGSGFHYLKNVSRDENPESIFSVDWDIQNTWDVLQREENIHLRLTMMGQLDEVALADGEPPQNKPGNPESLKYLIAHRHGENLDSQFVSVIEPYKDNRYIESITPVALKVDGGEVNSSEAAAVKVKLTNGRTDYIVNSLNANVTYTVDDKFTFKGFFGVYSEENGKSVYGYLHDGKLLKTDKEPLIYVPKGRLKGTVVNFTEELSLTNEINVRIEGPHHLVKDLIGEHIYVENDGERNAVYEIEGIKHRKGNEYTLEIGDTTLIRKYVDKDDFSQGYVSNIAKGAQFTIPMSQTWSSQ